MASSSWLSAPASLLLLFLLWPPLAWLAVLITAWIAYFFRDPPRVTPLRDGLVVAPGDGRICAIELVRPPAELGLGEASALRVLDLPFDLRRCTSTAPRSPAASSDRSMYRAASSTPPPTRPAEENERRGIVIDGGADS